jgi:acyl-coenzyme A synthetase/AMP-(fatty) acid ligase
VEWAVDKFEVGPEDRLASHAPFHFDLSVFDLYGAALAGAAVHLLAGGAGSFGATMASIIAQQKISVWYSVPSALILLCDAARAEDLAGLRVVLFAGEVFPPKHLRRLRELVPGCLLANLYGPTETNVCTYHIVEDEVTGDSPLPIGRACENQEVFALDDQLRPVDDGEVGELWVRGPTVMKGYWGSSPQGAVQQNTLQELYADPTYRTGDLVRRRPDGAYEFLGRRDHQVKSRGYRIELGEIEAVLVAHPDVREAVVVAVPDERIGNALVAYVAVETDVDGLALKQHCADRLPRYMIPGVVHIAAELPHTSTGKLDRRAMAARAAGEIAPGPGPISG